jgi:murein DD-endopeptidase MepM/ murein hydrolase activator NlpD
MIYNILGENYAPKFSLPFAEKFVPGDFIPLDLSAGNKKLAKKDVSTDVLLDKHIFRKIEKRGAKGAWGGYGEKRDLYRRSEVFADSSAYRNIHLGVDFWLPTGTPIAAPLPGVVHSFADNDSPGDYGPTIVLEHYIGNQTIYSLYGHLSRGSLVGLKEGRIVARGETFATLGAPFENRDWPPHLHFQLINDMEGKQGDYPGVCSEKEQERYLANCPDPLAFFGAFWNRILKPEVLVQKD